ncbi:MAG: hypothetical protein MJB57_06840 [Gemmatimonadetes bacterium]|nr:hypothetical protein [Gemmatimonadota bacterium]
MARCEGTTKAGARCRRRAAGGSAYCAQHEPAVEATGASGDAERSATEGRRAPDPGRRRHPLADAALIGLVAVGLLTLRRVIRLLR